MRRRIALIVALAVPFVFAQTNAVPADEEPMHKVAFKNDYVELLQVSIPAGQSTQFHTHSHNGAVIYLSNTQLRIDEPGKSTSTTNKPRAGATVVREYAEKPFTHRVNNVGKNTFEAIDIEVLKRPEGPEVPAITELSAENPSIRIYRWELAAGETSKQHTHERPFFVIAASPMSLRMTGADGAAMEHDVKTGDFHYVDEKVTHTLTNRGAGKGSIVEVELK